MLEIVRQRAIELGRPVDLREGDAHALPFSDDSFDSVVCTYSLCNIPDPQLAVNEMKRVLRPGGKLILVDHIRAAVKPVFWLQKLMEFFAVRIEGEHATRRPARSRLRSPNSTSSSESASATRASSNVSSRSSPSAQVDSDGSEPSSPSQRLISEEGDFSGYAHAVRNHRRSDPGDHGRHHPHAQ